MHGVTRKVCPPFASLLAFLAPARTRRLSATCADILLSPFGTTFRGHSRAELYTEDASHHDSSVARRCRAPAARMQGSQLCRGTPRRTSRWHLQGTGKRRGAPTAVLQIPREARSRAVQQASGQQARPVPTFKSLSCQLAHDRQIHSQLHLPYRLRLPSRRLILGQTPKSSKQRWTSSERRPGSWTCSRSWRRSSKS